MCRQRQQTIGKTLRAAIVTLKDDFSVNACHPP
jgi:hypothetical protein